MAILTWMNAVDPTDNCGPISESLHDASPGLEGSE